MGYYKNKEIANQVEEPERELPPRPAKTHLAYQYYESRAVRARQEKQMRRAQRADRLETSLVVFFIIVLGVIAVLGWV
jgi:hypothetical protein